MNSTKFIGFALILISLAVGYVGINKIADSSKKINLLGIQIEASDESGKQEGFLYLGTAIVLFAGGVYSLRGKSDN